MSSSDNYVFESSMMPDMNAEKFVDKKLTYMLDSNQGSYSGNQIIFESSQTSNSGKWASFSESYFTIPVVIALQSSQDITAAASPFMVGFKAGYYHLVDSIQVDLNGTNVCQLTPYTNVFTHFKIMSTWSTDSMAKYGTSIGFWKDDATSLTYSAAASLSGNGVLNNSALGAFTSLAATSFVGAAWNNGFIQRLRAIGYTPTGGFGGLSAFYTTPQSTGLNYFTNNAGANAARVYYWNIIAKIRPGDLHDFFDKIPLTRGAYFRITLNINTASFSVTSVAGPLISIAAAANLTVNGRTCPIMVASGAANQPLAASIAVNAGASVISVAVGVGSATVGGVTVQNTIMTSCRWYVPLYTMIPSYEEQFLVTFPTRTIEYEDVYNFIVTGVTAGSTFNNLLSNGITNPKTLLVVPVLNGAANNNAAIAFSEIQSPFSSCPGTTCPLAAINQYNVQLSGSNVYQNNEQYEFSNFMDELAKCGLNGGNNDYLDSGLISEADFTYAYRYYLTDLSRRLPQEDAYPKSVQITGVNLSAKILDLICFITFGRSIKIRTSDCSILTD